MNDSDALNAGQFTSSTHARRVAVTPAIPENLGVVCVIAEFREIPYFAAEVLFFFVDASFLSVVLCFFLPKTSNHIFAKVSAEKIFFEK